MDKLKSRDGVFWMEVYQGFSEFAHTQMEKVWSRIILAHNNFFLSYSMFVCAMYWFFEITFFQLPYHYLSRQKVLTQWAQPSLHSPRSYHYLFFIGTNSMFACFQMYVESTFSCFFFCFFQLSYDFFSPQTCVDSVGATIFTFPVVIQLNVFIAVPNHFVFWKSKILFLQVST